VIVDFRGGGEGGAAATSGVALFDREGGGETLDGVDSRGGQPLKVEAGVGGEAFEVPPLALGVDGVESEGRLARAGRAGEDNEAVFGDVEIEAGEIVLAGAADAEEIAGAAHGWRGRHRAGPGLGGRGGRGIDVDAPVAAIKADMAVGKRKERMVAPHTDVAAGVELGAALADENGAGENKLPAIPFDAETLAVTVTAVPCGSLTFFMCHDGLLL